MILTCSGVAKDPPACSGVKDGPLVRVVDKVKNAVTRVRGEVSIELSIVKLFPGEGVHDISRAESVLIVN
jgi:hypothetical protein